MIVDVIFSKNGNVNVSLMKWNKNAKLVVSKKSNLYIKKEQIDHKLL